jgi:uncharacterized membrane protein
MPPIDALNILKWIHFVAMAMGAGGAITALLLSGFEETREDLRGLAATVWKQTAGWGFRIAFLAGLGLLGLKLYRQTHPFDEMYLHLKLVLVFVLMGVSEMTPKMLAKAKRGGAMLTLFLFLGISFIVYNKSLFPSKQRPPQMPPASAEAQTAPK